MCPPVCRLISPNWLILWLHQTWQWKLLIYRWFSHLNTQFMEDFPLPRLIASGYLRILDFRICIEARKKQWAWHRVFPRHLSVGALGIPRFIELLSAGFCEWELVPTAVSWCHFQGIQSTIRVSWTSAEQVGFRVGVCKPPPHGAAAATSQSLRSVGPGPGVACRVCRSADRQDEKTGCRWGNPGHLFTEFGVHGCFFMDG